jgi:hypothetical protein
VSVKLSRLVAFVEAHKAYDTVRRERAAIEQRFAAAERGLRRAWDDLTPSEQRELNEAYALREEGTS